MNVIIGDAPLRQKLVLALGVLQRPVEVVELYLAEFHMLAAGVEKLLCVFNAAVAGKAEVAYLAQFLLPNEEINNAELPVEIVFDGGFVNVVHKVEVEVLNAAFF